MQQLHQGVVPTSMQRPKRIAKRLHQIFPKKPLSTCQASVAHLYFHKDWHALEEAVKLGMPGAPLLEDLSPVDVASRTTLHYNIICNELADVDPNCNFTKPTSPADEAVYYMLDPYHRVEQAQGRYHQLLASEALQESLPTAKTTRVNRQYAPLVSLANDEIMLALPGMLATWWSVNIPHQKAVTEIWRELELDPNDRIALLHAGSYWSICCFHYANTIDWTMVMGVSFLFAERYASLAIQDGVTLGELVKIIDDENSSKETSDQALRGIGDLLFNETARYLEVLARDDLVDVFRGQPEAFSSNAKAALKILANPKSRRGTWKS